MVKLSEDMIVARTRVSDMNQVKKLNCWGAELSDVSVISRLRNVEVLSLSVNSIATLADIQHCKNLQELYIRKNCIPDISEVCYLRDLPRLKNLWLEENPCCAGGDADLYRWTVIRNLPQLQKLDNVAVTSEEMAEAMRRGLDLDHPLDGGSSNQSARLRGGHQHQQQQQPPVEEDRRPSGGQQRGSYHEPEPELARRESVQSPSRRVSNAVWPAEERQPSSQHQETEYERQYSASTPSSRHQSFSHDNGGYTTPGRQSLVREATPEHGPGEHGRRVSLREEQSRYQHQHRTSYPSPGQEYHRGQETRSMAEYYSAQQSRATTPSSEDTAGPSSLQPEVRRSRSRSELSLAPIGELQLGQPAAVTAGRGPLSPAGPAAGGRGQLSRENSSLGTVGGRQSGAATPATEMGPGSGHYTPDPRTIVEEHYRDIHRQVDQQLEGAAQLVANRALSPQRPYPVRPRNRNSNVLSAILCLIKEIDGPSLEVVEMAVRCRMEELED